MQTILIQGHRGSSENYPENTILAFDKAIEEGANGIEVDIRKTSDNVLIVMHDVTLNRTTNGHGNVTDRTWEYISGLDAGSWKGSQFAGEKVPKLDDVLTRYKDLPVFITLHIKVADTTDLGLIVDDVVSRGMLQQVHFFGSYSDINFIKAYNPNCFTHNDGQPSISTYNNALQNAIENNHDAISVNGLSTDAHMQTMVHAIHDAGKFVHVSYLSNDYAAKTQKLIDMGVEFILGNNPLAMVEAVSANGMQQINPSSVFTPNLPPEPPVLTEIRPLKVRGKFDGRWREPAKVYTKIYGQWLETGEMLGRP